MLFILSIEIGGDYSKPNEDSVSFSIASDDQIDDGKEKHGLFVHQRQLVGGYVNHLITRLVIILLIILDIIFVIIAVSLSGEGKLCFNFNLKC